MILSDRLESSRANEAVAAIKLGSPVIIRCLIINWVTSLRLRSRVSHFGRARVLTAICIAVLLSVQSRVKTHTLPLRYQVRKSLLVAIYLQKHFVCEILRNWVKSHFDKIASYRCPAVFRFAGVRSQQKTYTLLFLTRSCKLVAVTLYSQKN